MHCPSQPKRIPQEQIVHLRPGSVLQFWENCGAQFQVVLCTFYHFAKTESWKAIRTAFTIVAGAYSGNLPASNNTDPRLVGGNQSNWLGYVSQSSFLAGPSIVYVNHLHGCITVGYKRQISPNLIKPSHSDSRDQVPCKELERHFSTEITLYSTTPRINLWTLMKSWASNRIQVGLTRLFYSGKRLNNWT